MKKFRTVFFNGYQKEEVDEYVESLLNQVGQLTQASGESAEKDNQIQELKIQLGDKEKEAEAAREQLKELEEKVQLLTQLENSL